jgi:hypothetical protein
MKRSDGAQPRDLAMAGAAAASTALALVLLLTTLATPKDFNTRLADLTSAAEATQRLARPIRNAEILPAGAICEAAGEGARTLAASLRDAAAQAGLQAVRVSVMPQGGQAVRGRLATLDVRFEAEGGYDAALQMLDVIGRQKPQVFADTVDLTSKAAAVSLSFSGRAFCAS